MNRLITADFSSENVVNTKQFIYITNNEAQFELALLSTFNSQFEFLIFIEKDLYDIKTNYAIPLNVKITNDVGSLIMLLPKFAGVITTVGHLSPVLSNAIKKILKTSAQLNLPLIEVPHGLYQWGYNLSDDSQIVNVGSFEYGSGGVVPTIAEHQINWFHEDGPGYPRYQKETLRKPTDNIVPEYTVITTNTNWYMYGHFEQRTLFNILFAHAMENPTQIFIWCAHPAEVKKDTLLASMLAIKPQNIFLYGLTKEIYFNGIDTTEDVIKYAKNGVSTVSSCLLDYEIHKIPVMLFNTEGLTKIIKSMPIVSVFSTAQEFRETQAKAIVTNLLYPYKVDKFDNELNCIKKTTEFNTLQNLLMHIE